MTAHLLKPKEDFTGEIFIAGVEKDHTCREVEKFILQYEDEFMRKALGYDLYTAFYADLGASSQTQRFLDLLNGKVYTYSGINVHYKGIRAAAARYVYFHYMRNSITQTTAVGEAKPKSENADAASPADKMVTAWNTMSKLLADTWDYLDAYKESDVLVYPEWQKRQTCFKSFRPINRFGI